MSKTPKEATATKIPKGGANIVNLPMDSIGEKKGFNPRSDLGDMVALKRSLKEHGVISPITVCPTKPGADSYYVVAGHRRFAALKETGKANVPAIIRDIDIGSDEALALAMSENSGDARTELAPMDQAKAFRRLLDSNGGANNEDTVGKLCGCSAMSIKRTLKLLEVPESIRKRVAAGEIGKLAAIATLDIPEEVRDRVSAKIVKNTTEADVLRMATEAKRELRAKMKDKDEKKGTATHTKTGKISKHNVPFGTLPTAPGDKSVFRGVGAKDIRKQIKRAGADTLNARDEKNDEEYTAKSNQLATLLWVVGSITEISTDSKDFGRHLKEIEDRLTAEMDAAEAKPKTTSVKKSERHVKSNRHTKSSRHTKSHAKSTTTSRTAKSSG